MKQICRLAAATNVKRSTCVFCVCLRVSLRAMNDTVPPVIEPALHSEYVVKESSTLRVMCEARGVPVPVIDWHRAVTAHNYTSDALLASLVCLTHTSTSLTHSLSVFMPDTHSCL